MILLDPDLEPDPAPKTNSVKRVGALALTRNSKTNACDVRLPSARTLARFLAAAQAAVRLKGQVTVLLTTDAAIAKLNRQFRGKNKATDVLSFPASGVGAEGMAGDLAISVTTAMGQAAEQRHSLAVEIKVLVLHGLLHLAGFDHEVDDGKMARRERLLRARLGLPQGLIERAGFPTLSPEKRRKDAAREIGGGSTKRDAGKHTSGAKARAESASLIVGVKTPTYRRRSTAKAERL